MSDALRDRVVSALGDAYEIGREIGRGGMGVVYAATDRNLRRGVAVKVLPPELAYRDDVRQRFLREAQTAAQLSHPHIVPIYAVEERDGLVCFAMALVEGESLAGRISREGRLSIPESCRILQAVADALGYAHSRGTVHRDVKPDNILLDRNGQVMVTDFGIARAAEGDARLTVTGIAVGTPAYMSPEQAMGEKDVDGRSDIYSLAIVGYQMLAGTLPFHAANTPAMLMKHISETPPPIGEVRPDAPPALVHALERAMSKRPAERWPTADEFRDEVSRIRRGESSFVRQPLPPTAADPSSDAAGGRAPPRESSAWKHPVPAGAAVVRNAIGPARRRTSPSGADSTGSGRDAVEAANAGWQPRRPSIGEPERDLAPLPAWMPPSWRQARQQWGRGAPVQGRPRGRDNLTGFAQLSPEEKVRQFRRRTGSGAVTIAMLATINLAFSPQFPWFLFPAGAMAIAWARRAAMLWADGLRMRDIFGGKARDRVARLEASPGGSDRPAATPAERLAPADVLAGPHGRAVVRAASDQSTIHEAIAKLTKADRDLIPDVLPTVDALAERVGSLALALHRLEEDLQPAALEDLDRRLTAAKARPQSSERDRKVELLERQRSTLGELAARRETLASQLESASLMLQNMRLDLIALRSAGVQSVLNDVGSATQEARALSREIAHVLEAAKQVR